MFMLSIFVVVKVVAPATLKVELKVVAAVVTSSVDPAVKAPSVKAPDAFIVPSTINPSLILILEESAELNVVPLNSILPKATCPVPDGVKIISSFSPLSA